jgi:2,4-dienoyl-CoA reductase-like NADH-dependent reductase (Old Yellow Enzyme family)
MQLAPIKGPFGEFYAKPRAATKADIDHVVAGFVHAAEYLAAAGFDGMQLHAAHGYLLAQFLSRSMNRRTDDYGGSLRNRMRIIVDIGNGIRTSKLIPKGFMLGIKLNSVEFQDEGMTAEEAREICAALDTEVGFDYIELSGGTWANFGTTMTWERESTRRRESFFLEFADLIVPALGPTPRRTKVYITGGLRSAAAMVDALDVVDGVGLARPAAQEPRLANDILTGLVSSAIRPIKELEDVPMGVPLAATQLGQIAMGQEPLDASDEKESKAYLGDHKIWYDAMMAGVDNLQFGGYVKLSTPQRPYGRVY